MKILKFIRWQWAKFDSWQRWYMLAAGLFGSGLVAPTNTLARRLLIGSAGVIFAALLIKWLWIDTMIASYKRFQEEEQKLFETIKNSDKK